MKFATSAVIGFVYMLTVSLIVIFSGNYAFWYPVPIFALLVGIIIGPSKTVGLITSAGSIVAFLVYILMHFGSVSLKQAGLLSGIIGMPGGYLPILIIAVLIVFFLAFLGYLVGSSFEIARDGAPEKES